MDNVELLVLRSLLYNEDYARKVVPFIQGDYFQQPSQKIVFEEVSSFITEYDELPSKEALYIEVEKRNDVNEEVYKQVKELIEVLNDEPADEDWLVNTSEKWCRDRAIYLALMESIQLADGKDDKKGRDAIPTILSDALAVSFDNNIGHDYLKDYEERYEGYHRKEDKIPFDLEYFNKITKGGIPNKTLNIALAGTGVGKSLFMCHMASACLLQSKNVLYITMEMSEEKIAERIDANCLNLNIKDIGDLPQVMFKSKIADLQKRTTGKIVIKEYPTASAHAGHFRSLLNELKLKKSFIPDIIFIDYLNICASSRYKGHIVNSYTYVKAIAEELRGLAVEFDLPIVSATQTTRSGFGSSDPDLTDTSESFGLPATADLMFALISSEELEAEGRLKVKQLKNRYNDPTSHRSFRVGIDRAKMKLFDVADSTSAVYDAAQEEDAADAYDTVKQNQARLSKFAEWNV